MELDQLFSTESIKNLIELDPGLPRSGKKSLENENFSRSGKSLGSLVFRVREIAKNLKKPGKSQGISKFSQN